MVRDLRHALRWMARTPGFTAISLLSLALGIGANNAIFSLMYTVMLRRLPVEHPERLVQLLHRVPREGHQASNFSWPAFEQLREQNSVYIRLKIALFAPIPSARDNKLIAVN